MFLDGGIIGFLRFGGVIISSMWLAVWDISPGGETESNCKYVRMRCLTVGTIDFLESVSGRRKEYVLAKKHFPPVNG